MIGQNQWLRGGSTVGAAIALTTADNTDIQTWAILQQCEVLMAGVIIETTIVSGVDVVVEFDRVPKNGGTREAAFASITMATASSTGKVYYTVPTTRKILYPGDRVIVQNAVCATDPAKAGTCYPFLLVNPQPERPANVTGMVDGTT